MTAIIQKDPYQLVCQAFEYNEIHELLLGEKGYGYKLNFRSDWTSPEEKTDITVLYRSLVKFYIENNKSPLISQKILVALTSLSQSHWSIYVVAGIFTFEAYARNQDDPNLNLDLIQISNHLKNIIQHNRASLMQEKLYGGRSFDYGMYESLTRASAICVKSGGPSCIEDNPNANDHFEALTTFTLTLPNKIANLSDSFLNTFMQSANITLKGSPILHGTGYVPAQDSTWTYTMEKQKLPTGETQLICMINNLYFDRIQLLKVTEEFNLIPQLNTVIWLENSNQQINIPSDALQKISDMKIPFSIEIRLMDSNSTT